MKDRRFVFIDSGAAQDIVSARTLQSDDFDDGRILGLSLIGEVTQQHLLPHTQLVEAGGGLYVLSDKDSGHSNFMVLDLDAAPIFKNSTAKDALTKFQKLLRFATRRWAKVSPAPNERLITGSTKAAVFPYPINAQTSVRITIELAPDSQRRQKRAKGEELLAFRIGTDEGGGPNEQAPVTNFRKAVDHLSHADALLDARSQTANAQTRIESMAVTRLQPGSSHGTVAGCNFEQWQSYLTVKQREFVERDLTSPHRIEGPAGTGKTLSLVLKCIAQLRKAKTSGREHRALFIAHSDATRRAIQSMFEPELGSATQDTSTLLLQSVKIATLHELCSELLRYEVSETELLDRDAFESKQTQMLYTIEALQEAKRDDLASHRPHMTDAFVGFMESTDEWVVAEMMQHEISVVIKGRADEDLEKYKRLPRLKYGLPVANDGDKAFVFVIFNAYQRRLRASGQFDTDDVVLSAQQQLDTPIWRRRREREGYDAIYIDETHLFNLNELSVFHRLTRLAHEFPIAYSADISQSLGDRGWSDNSLGDAIIGAERSEEMQSEQTTFSSIFRCSPEIVNLAFSVTSAGATLFTNFDDPLKAASSAFTEAEERKCAPPRYRLLPSDDAMIAEAFLEADDLAEEMHSSRGDVAIVVFGDELFAQTEKAARLANKPVEVVKHRGDMDVVRRARNSGRFVLSTPDFVGGLEFDGVVLVGVDKGRVPPRLSHDSFDSENFVNYATHQRLYVAITRARFRVVILGVKARGESPIFAYAIKHNIVEVV